MLLTMSVLKIQDNETGHDKKGKKEKSPAQRQPGYHADKGTACGHRFTDQQQEINMLISATANCLQQLGRVKSP